MASTSVCGYLVITSIIQFLNYETNVNLQIINESPSDFPAVTLCNLKPFNKQRSQSYVYNLLNQSNLSRLLILGTVNTSETAYGLINVASDLLKLSIASDQNLTIQTRKQLGWNIEEMLISCYYNSKTCLPSDFVYIQDYDYLNCYTFNSGKDSSGNTSTIRQAYMSGYNKGLEMELFIGESSVNDLFSYKSGVLVVVHNQSITPIISSEGINAATGQETNIAIRRTFTTYLPKPYHNCVENNTSSDGYISNLFKAVFDQLNQSTYRQKYCFRLCYQNSVIKECSCLDPSVENPFKRNNNKLNFCTNLTQYQCLNTTKTTFYSTKISLKCAMDCPLECSSITYTTSIHVASWPTETYANWLQLQPNLVQSFQNNQTNFNKIQTSVAKLNIFYEEMLYTQISETASVTW